MTQELVEKSFAITFLFLGEKKNLPRRKKILIIIVKVIFPPRGFFPQRFTHGKKKMYP